MAQRLDYAPNTRKMRRRRWFIPFTVLLAVAASVGLAIPQFKSFQQRQSRRAVIRQQFSTQLANAERWLDSGRVDDAAVAILTAEFPTHAEAKLFWRSELDSFDRRATLTRHRLSKLSAQQDAEEEVKEKAEQIQREIDAKNGKKIIVVRGCFFPRQKTLDALADRAAAQLKNGNNAQALAICQQIVLLDPVFHFNKDFWANIPH